MLRWITAAIPPSSSLRPAAENLVQSVGVQVLLAGGVVAAGLMGIMQWMRLAFASPSGQCSSWSVRNPVSRVIDERDAREHDALMRCGGGRSWPPRRVMTVGWR